MGNRSASNPNQSRESSASSEYSVHSSNVQQSSIFNTTTDQGSSGSDVRSNSTPVSNSWLSVLPEALLDVFFARAQWTTFYILDDTTMRQRLCSNLVPRYLLYAVYAVSARYTTYPEGFYEAVRASEYYAMQARNEIDTDEPSLYALQALILLAIAFLAAGNGKKSYMLLCKCIYATYRPTAKLKQQVRLAWPWLLVWLKSWTIRSKLHPWSASCGENCSGRCISWIDSCHAALNVHV
jgi:hypothetical protein